MNLSPARLPDRLARGDKLVHVEVTPPRSYSAKRVIENVRLLQNAGVDYINVADTPTARLRMSAWAICHLVESELAQETVLHFPTRGRNLLRVQSDLLAAYAIGLRNVFVTMGDPVDIGDYPGAGNTFDLAPSALVALIKKKMNAGVDLRGRSIGDPTQFTVGCALNVASTNLSRELKVLERKLAGGADFALCQALYVPDRLQTFHDCYERTFANTCQLPLLISLMPLQSSRHACFLNDKVPGIYIPDEIMRRMASAKDPETEGITIALEIFDQLQPRPQGIYVIPSYERYDLAAELIRAIKSR